MKTHTSQFKTNLTQIGRQIDSIITYGSTTLHDELYAVSVLYEGSILKSVMKQLDIESSVDIELGTVVNYQLGVLVGNSYEYLDYGNYVVYKSEKQEDTNTYKITCFDKLLYSMIDYEDLNITYPIKIRNYINAICTKLGLTFANSTDTFANYDKEIPNELYLEADGKSLGYTFRDVLDELAEVTASTICIDSQDRLEIRYINDTEDTIDEEFLKDINVTFGEQYGAVNTIVLSRSAGADNIYYPETLPENPVEIKITDNQIMNGLNRDTYMPDIYDKLNGLTFYINDFSSTGILYYDLCDRYNVQVEEQTYSCIMLNDEINITSGIEELIHTELLEESETDYKKSDTTDRRINQTNLIVDKQNQQIQGIITQIGDRSQKTTTITQDIDGIESKVEEFVDYEREFDVYTQAHLEDAMAQDLLQIEVRGNITYEEPYLFPSENLYPSDDLQPNMEGSELR